MTLRSHGYHTLARPADRECRTVVDQARAIILKRSRRDGLLRAGTGLTWLPACAILKRREPNNIELPRVAAFAELLESRKSGFSRLRPKRRGLHGYRESSVRG